MGFVALSSVTDHSSSPSRERYPLKHHLVYIVSNTYYCLSIQPLLSDLTRLQQRRWTSEEMQAFAPGTPSPDQVECYIEVPIVSSLFILLMYIHSNE